jgi:peptide/nickel transport system ATP-binding protein
MPLLKVQGLKTYFYIENNKYPAVDDVSFTLDEGKILAIIGESGSGKSVMAMSIMHLIDPPGKISGGKIIFKGENLLEKTERQMKKIRGNET